jgi:hypothetical protein
MKQLMKQISPNLSRPTGTIRISRNIGYRGKTRIKQIIDAYRPNIVFYPRKKIKKMKMPDVQADYYFFGNPSNEYAWGSGTTFEEVVSDSYKGFMEWVGIDHPSSLDDEDFIDQLWITELNECDIYPTDKSTHDQIQQGNAAGKYVKSGDLVILKR